MSRRLYSEAVALGDLLERTAARCPAAEAVVFPEERLTYGELCDRARTVARGLIALGVRPGDHVGILMPNCLDAIAAFFGVALAGAVLVPVNTRYRTDELRFLVDDADLVAVLTTDLVDHHVDLTELLERSLRERWPPRLRSIVLLGAKRPPGMVDRAAFEAAGAAVTDAELEHRRLAVRVRDVGAILYTSGTTADPRGCLLTHEALVRDWLSAGHRFGIGAGDRCWDPCPLFHLAGIGPLLFTVAAGGAFISTRWYDPAVSLELIERERATILYPAYPPITMALLKHPRFPEADLSAVRGMLNVAPPDTMRQMQAAIPHAVQISTYGITEGGGAVTYNELDEDADTRARTCGPPLPGVEVRIAGDAPRGELLVRGFNVCEGYHKDVAKTAATIDADGWLHTGDLGELDPDGRVIFLGRLKEMLKVGGENVAPAEIEARLSTHPAVKLVQVVGVPDERLVEVPAAFVELVAGREATAEELLEHCRGHIASFKLPRHVRFVDRWPLSATKIQRFRLREQLLDELGLTDSYAVASSAAARPARRPKTSAGPSVPPAPG